MRIELCEIWLDDGVSVTASDIIGSSSETKPTTVNEGSTFYEVDTGALYYYNGTTWITKA